MEKEPPLEVIKTLLKYGKVSLLPLGKKSKRYHVELELADGRVIEADNDSIEKTIDKILVVLQEMTGEKSKKKK